MQPRICPCGDSALTVELGDSIDDGINAAVLALEEALLETGNGVAETVPTYRSLLVTFDPFQTSFDALSERIRTIAAASVAAERPCRHWRIPVAYGGDFGIDLEAVATAHGLTADEVVHRHSAALYRVFMIGFVPGFTYLGGLDPQLETPRLAVPRRTTPAGSISVGGRQAAVASIEAPSGWHLLGRTPVRVFMATRDPVCLLAPGDRVSFEPIAHAAWRDLSLAAHAGERVAEQVT